jgi:Rieske Fe-S protein
MKAAAAAALLSCQHMGCSASYLKFGMLETAAPAAENTFETAAIG